MAVVNLFMAIMLSLKTKKIEPIAAKPANLSKLRWAMARHDIASITII